MFDVGFAEIFLLGVIGLLVLGPEKLPAVARTLGGLMRKARASWASLRSTIEAELAEADVAKPMKEVADEIKQIGKDLKPDLPDVNSILKPAPKHSSDPQHTAGTDDSSSAEGITEKTDEPRMDQPGIDQPTSSKL